MALADMTQEETDARNRERCKNIAERIESIAAGCLYRDADGEEHDASELEDIPDDWEQFTIYDYLDDVLDINFLIDCQHRYKSCRLLVAFGGPNVYVDTETGQVELYWWGDTAKYPLSRSSRDAVDAAFEEIYEMGR